MPISVRALLAAAAMAVVVALTGCGVSVSDGPADLGDAYAPAQLPNAKPPPQPTASSAEGLVRDFLVAAVGGGESVSSFLTPNARKRLPSNTDAPGITIIKDVVSPQLSQQPGVLSVNVGYTVIGTLTDEGRVVPAATPGQGTMHFFVVQAPDRSSQLRIDRVEGMPRGLVLSQDALDNTYYRQQPIYFWDRANKVLVPDLRYVPLTITTLQRANAIVGWLLHGPSPLLGSVNVLPANTSMSAGATLHDSTLQLNLSPQAGALGPAGLQRLYYQLQASLLPSTILDLQLTVGTTQVLPAGPSTYMQYELSSQLRTTITKFEIVDQQVKQIASEASATPSPELAILKANENRNVLYAAINRENDTAALVRQTGTYPTLTIVRDGVASRVVQGLAKTADVGRPRPAWVPGTRILLIPWAGTLYQVDTNPTSGTLRATPVSGGLSDVTTAAIAPDGRRVALVAGGLVRVAQLTVNDTTVAIQGPTPSIMVDPALVASGVAWQNPSRLYVVGRSGDRGALWQVTIDGVVATNKSESLHGKIPDDVVSYPQTVFSPTGEAVMHIIGAPPPDKCPVPTPSRTCDIYRISELSATSDPTTNPFYVD